MSDEQKKLLLEILDSVLQSKTIEVYGFGSRFDGTAQVGSDLDLLLQGETALSFELLGALRGALEDSDLPFRVDLIDANRADSEFLRRIGAKTKLWPESTDEAGKTA